MAKAGRENAWWPHGGALVAADASRPSTCDRMFELAADFLARLPGRSVRGVVNKTDIGVPGLTKFDRRGLAPEHVMISSAKTGEGVTAAFEAIAMDICQRP